jgi:hypothetical protein
MKKLMALLLGITIILFLFGNTEAQTEYSIPPAYPVYKNCPAVESCIYYASCNFLDTTEPYSPKVACTPSSNFCIGLIYDDIAHAIKIRDTTDQFQTYPCSIFGDQQIPIDYGASRDGGLTNIVARATNYSLPYDAIYDSSMSRFWIAYADGIRSTHFYTYDPVSQVLNLSASFIGSTALGAQTSFTFVGFLTEGTPNNQPLALVAYRNWSGSFPCPSSSDSNYVMGYLYYRNGSFYKNIGHIFGAGIGCITFNSPNFYTLGWRGFLSPVYSATPAGLEMQGEWQYTTGAVVNTYGSYFPVNTMASFPNVPPFDGLSYWDNSKVIYHANVNGTNFTNGIYSSQSTNLQTFSSGALYFPFDSGIQQDIPLTDIASGNKEVFIYDVRNNISTNRGIYAYNVPLTPIKVTAIGFNPLTFQQTPNPIVVGVTLSCENYTQTETTDATSGIANFYSPCLTTSPHSISFASVTNFPNVYNYTFNIFQGCSSHNIKATFGSEYILRVTVTDGLIHTPASGATVTLDSDTAVTDYQGKANFTIFPLDATSFIVANNSAICFQDLSLSGIPHPYFYSVSKPNYVLVQENPLYLANGIGVNNLNSTKITTIFPNGINVQISAHTNDGFSVNPSTTITNWSGLFTQSNLVTSGYIPNQTSAGGFPINIILYSNLSAYNLTVSNLFNNVTQTQVVEITNGTNDNCYNGFCSIDFVFPYAFINFPCFQNNDCLGGTCLGSIFYDLLGCSVGTCSYTQTFCSSCDERVGCYDSGTTETCNGDLDCDKTCTAESSAQYGYCSSTGLCIYKNIICDNNVPCINTTIPVLSANGSVIGNYSAGICSNHQVCFSQSTSQSIFQITKQYVNIGFILNPASVTTETRLYKDQRVSCSPTEASATERHCIIGVNVPKIETGSIPESNQIVTTVGNSVNNWQFEVNQFDSNYYRFFDLSYQCDLNCGLDVITCPYGCNQETGFCYQSPVSGGSGGGLIAGCNQSIFSPICSIGNLVMNTTTNITLSQSLMGGGYGFVLLFITPIFYIMMLIVGIMIMASWVTKHMEVGVASGVVMMIVMATVFPELVWITIVVVVISGFIVGRQVIRAVNG